MILVIKQVEICFKNRFFYDDCSGLVGQCCDVVLVGAHLAQENPRGSGFRNGEGMGREETGRSVYVQPGTRVDGSYHSKEGSK
jgi:hypothetical protein